MAFYKTQFGKQCSNCGTEQMDFRQFVPKADGPICVQPQGPPRHGFYVCGECAPLYGVSKPVKLVMPVTTKDDWLTFAMRCYSRLVGYTAPESIVDLTDTLHELQKRG